jgi:hypothetical protein
MALGGGGMLEYDAQRVFQRLLNARPPVPGQHLIDPIDEVIGEASEDVPQAMIFSRSLSNASFCTIIHHSERTSRGRAERFDGMRNTTI